jgi:hypothetical protein
VQHRFFYGPGTSGTVDNVDVHGANYFGILVVGNLVDSGGNETNPGATSVDITSSKVHDWRKPVQRHATRCCDLLPGFHIGFQRDRNNLKQQHLALSEGRDYREWSGVGSNG